MYDVYNQRLSVFDLYFQGQPLRLGITDFELSEIPDIENVRIDTKIESIAYIQPELSKVIQSMCLILSSKVNR